MIQGTASDAGKSTVVAAICRILKRRGVHTAPFKPQNMALNSAVTPDGGEIGRAQAVQALAAGVELDVDFNPILLKPSSDTGAQVIIHGKAISQMQAQQYHDYKKVAMDAVLVSHQRLKQKYQAIVVEGAGSPAEINLREGDIANMGFAEAVDCPVILVADIDKGGVFAQLVGTLELLSESERNRVKGFIINKFRGDIKLLESGLTWLENKTNKPVIGVLPYIRGLEIAAEDAITTQQVLDDVKFKVAIPVFPRISNHTDFDILRLHPNVEFIYVGPEQAIPSVDLIILPGSKNVRADLAHMQKVGWDKSIEKHLRYGGKVFGICGGYQMLGTEIKDPNGIEDIAGTSQGLGYLPIITELTDNKELKHTRAQLQFADEAVAITGYEIHCGISHVLDKTQGRELLSTNGADNGFINVDEQVAGCYLHGIFDTPAVIPALAKWCGIELTQQLDYQSLQQQAIDKLADACEQHLDLELLFKNINIS